MPFSFANSLQRSPAGMRTEALQRASPLPRKSFVAARPVAGVLEKILRN
jgi:hypothetical protein